MTNKIGVVLALDGEKEFANGMKQAQENAKQFDTALKALSEQYKGSANSMEALAQKQELLKQKEEAYSRVLSNAQSARSKVVEAYKLQKQSVEELTQALEKAQASGDASEIEKYQKALSSAQVTLSNLETRLSKWDTNVAKVKTSLSQNSQELVKNGNYMDEAAASADKCASSIDGMGDELKQAGQAAEQSSSGLKSVLQTIGQGALTEVGKLITDNIANLGQYAKQAAQYVVEVGSTFEASMSNVEALSGATGSSLEALSQKAQELGASTKFSASEAADAMGNMALAGWNTEQMLSGIDGVLDLAAASGMDLATSADVVAGNLAAFNMSAEESGKLADIIATAQAKSKTTADQLAEAYSTSATNLTQYGQSVETTTALLEGMASVNDTGSSAGTKLSAVMSQITSKMKDGAIAIGDTSVQVQDADGNFRDLIDIMADVSDATDGMGDAQKAAALSATFNRTSLSAVNEILAVGSDQLREYKSQLESSDGAAKDMAATMQDNLKGAATEFSSALEGLGIAIYDKIKDPLTKVVDLGTNVISGLTGVISPAKTEMSEFGEYIESIQGTIDSSAQSVADSQKTISDAVGQVGEIETYINTVKELNDKDVLNVEEKQRLKAAYDGLCDLVPELKGYYSEETGQIELNTQAVIDLAKAKRDAIIEEAAAQAQSQALTAVTNAQIARDQAATAQEAAQARVDNLKAEQDNLTELSQQYKDLQYQQEQTQDPDQYDVLGSQMDTIREKFASYGLTIQDVTNDTQTYKDVFSSQLSQANSDLDAANEKLTEAEGQLSSTQSTYESTGEVVQQATAEMIEYADAQYELSHGMQETTNSAESEVEANYALADSGKEAADSGKTIADTWSEGSHTVGEAVEGLNTSAEGSIGTLVHFGDTAETTGEQLENYDQVVADNEKAKTREENTKHLTESLKEQGETAETAADQTDNATERMRNGLSKLSEAVIGTSDATKILKGAGDIAIDVLHGMAKESEEAAQEAAEQAQACSDAFQTSSQNIQDAWDNLKSEAEQTLTFSVTAEFDGGEDQTTETMNANLQSQIDGYQQYYENLQTLRQAMNEGIITPEFLSNLEEQGTDAANIIQHMAWTLENQENGVEQVQGISDKYMQMLDMQDTISTVLAGDQAALEDGLKSMGSTDEDFSALREAISSGLSGADADMQTQLQSLANTAQTVGATIPDGLAESIASGDVTAQQAIEQMQSSISGALDGLMQVVSESGDNQAQELVSSIQSGLSDGTTTATEAYSQLISALSDAAKSNDTAAQAEETGKAIPEGMASGMEDTSGVETAAQTLKDAAIDKLKEDDGSAKEAGKALGERFASGINEADVTTAASELAGKVSEALDGNTEDLTNAGGRAAGAYRDGMTQMQPSIQTMGAELAKSAVAGLSGEKESFTNSGAQAAGAYRSGIQDMQPSLQVAGGELARSAAAGLNGQKEAIQTAGTNAGGSYRTGIMGTLGDAVSAGNQLASAAANAAGGHGSEFNSIGVNMASGISTGLQSQIGAVAQQAASLVTAAINAAKAAGDIHSPSKKMQDLVGKMLGKGTQLGIALTSKDVKKESESMVDKAVRAAVASINKNSEKIRQAASSAASGVSEVWNSITDRAIANNFGVSKSTTKATGSGKKKKTTTTKKTTEEYYGDIFDAAEDYLDRMGGYHDLSIEEEAAYWTKVQKQLKKGTEAYAQASANIKSLKSEIGSVSVASSLLSGYETYFNVSEMAEVQYWDAVREQYKEGTDERLEADKQYYSSYKKYTSDLDTLDSNYKTSRQNTLDQISDLDAQYEKDVASNAEDLKKTNADYESDLQSLKDKAASLASEYNDDVADNQRSSQKLIDSYSKKNQNNLKRLQEYEDNYNENVKKNLKEREGLYSDYADDVRKVNDDLASDIQDLWDDYATAVENRAQQIAESFDIFDAFESESDSGKTLLFNMQAQAEGYEFWQDEIDKLSGKGIFSDELMKELTEKGPKEVASIVALNSLSDDDLKEYNDAYQKKMDIARDQATKENEDLKATTEQEAEELRIQASQDLEDLKNQLGEDLANNLQELQGIRSDYDENVSDLQQAMAEDKADYEEDLAENAKKLAEIQSTYKEKMDENAQAMEDLEEQHTKDVKENTDELEEIEKNYKKNSADLESQLSQLDSTYKTERQALTTAISSDLGTLAADLKKTASDEVAKIIQALQYSGYNYTNTSTNTASGTSTNTASGGTGSTASGSSSDGSGNSSVKKSVKNIINSGTKRSKTVTSAENKGHADLWKYIVKNYGRTPTQDMYRKIAAALDIQVNKKKDVSSAQKNAILAAMKKAGLRRGAKDVGDVWAWMDELGLGSELVLSRSDNAVLTRLPAHSAVVPANLTDNLWKWGAVNPDNLDLSGIMSAAALNRSVENGYRETVKVKDHSSGQIDQIIDLMAQYMPYLAQRLQVNVDGKKLVQAESDYTSNDLAMRSRRWR